MWRRPKSPAKTQSQAPTQQEIANRWKKVQDNVAFIYSEQFSGLDDDIKLALANRLLDRFLDEFQRFLDAP